MQIAALLFVVKELSWNFWSIKCVRAEVLAELAPPVSSFVLHSTFNSTNRANSSPTVKAAQGTLLINPRTEKLSLVRNTQVRRASVKPGPQSTCLSTCCCSVRVITGQMSHTILSLHTI